MICTDCMQLSNSDIMHLNGNLFIYERNEIFKKRTVRLIINTHILSHTITFVHTRPHINTHILIYTTIMYLIFGM